MLIIVILLGILFFTPHYRINPPSYTISLKRLTFFEQIQNTYRQIKYLVSNKSSTLAYGIMAPGSCATQPIELNFTGGELAEILNKAKPISILLYNIRIDVHDQKIIFSVTSAYPFFPGSLSGTGTLHDRTFTISEGYNGLVPIPKSLLSLIEKKANMYFNDLLKDNGFKLMNVQILDGRIHVSAFICPGLLKKNTMGNWVVDTTVVQPQEYNNIRY